MKGSLKHVFSQLTWSLVSFQLALTFITLLLHFLILEPEEQASVSLTFGSLKLTAYYAWPLILMAIIVSLPMINKIPPMMEIKLKLQSPPFGPWILQAPYWHFAIVSLLAGLSEEWLFRGVLQTSLGFYLSSFLFAVCHFLTPAYFVVAGIMGLYLGLIFDASQGNLLPVIVIHAVYDFVVLSLLKIQWNRELRDKFGPLH